MSQDRILGSAVTLQIYTSAGVVDFAELDGFTATDKSEKKEFRPLGQVAPHGQIIYGGYDLDFKGAKINADWDTVQADNDTALLAGESAPRYRVLQKTVWLDGTIEAWVYNDVILYNFKQDAAAANDEIKGNFTGFAPTRTRES
jgi:hypothetical protein